MSKRKKKQCAKLSFNDKIAIVHSVIIDEQDYQFLSKKYGCSVSCISKLIQAVQKDHEFL